MEGQIYNTQNKPWSNQSQMNMIWCSFLTLSDVGVWRLNLGRGGAESAPPIIWGTFSTLDPKNGSQPQNSPRLRYYDTKRTQKLCETCRNRHLSVSWILSSFCSRQGPPLWNWANFDHFCPLPARPNVIWLQKVVSYTPFTYLGKVKKNWQLFPLIFFGESPKYDRGGGFRPPPAPNRVNKNILQLGFLKAGKS